MKIQELKHNHSLTDLLKILLFAILMLAPISMVATRCLYVIANKNAYQSYYGETINEEQYSLTTTNNLQLNAMYSMESYPNITQSGWQDYFFIGEDWKIIQSNITLDTTNWYKFGFYKATNRTSVLFYSEDNNLQTEYYFDTSTQLRFEFRYLSTEKRYSFGNDEILQDTFLYEITYNNYSYLDNVFEYSVSQLEESSLFNWTQNTAIFSGINAMNVQIGINSPAITIILTYWLILTCIYVIIDIILKLFTYMTHALGNRKA